MEKSGALTAWLTEGEPWIAYRAILDLLCQPENSAPVRRYRKKMIEHPDVRLLVAELNDWPGAVLSSHRSARQLFHKLSFIADLGLRRNDPGMNEIIAKVTAHRSPENLFQLPMNIPQHYGGTGKEVWAWALCDAPLIIYSLRKIDPGKDPATRRAIDYLVSLARDNGWPCAVSKELGRFRGPGRKDDPCPYATLIMLKLLALCPDYSDHQVVRQAADSILQLWAQSRDRHPYMFFMGNDFRKLKAPLIWYDLLHVLDVLTRFAWLRKDNRLRQMVSVLEKKKNPDGRFSAESIYQEYKKWDFGQKKTPSRWITFIAQRIFARMERT